MNRVWIPARGSVVPPVVFIGPHGSVSRSLAMISGNVVGQLSPARSTSFANTSLFRPGTFMCPAPLWSLTALSHGESGTSLSGTSHLPPLQSWTSPLDCEQATTPGITRLTNMTTR